MEQTPPGGNRALVSIEQDLSCVRRGQHGTHAGRSKLDLLNVVLIWIAISMLYENIRTKGLKILAAGHAESKRTGSRYKDLRSWRRSVLNCEYPGFSHGGVSTGTLPLLSISEKYPDNVGGKDLTYYKRHRRRRYRRRRYRSNGTVRS